MLGVWLVRITPSSVRNPTSSARIVNDLEKALYAFTSNIVASVQEALFRMCKQPVMAKPTLAVAASLLASSG
jgi:hypothetical protein